MVREKIQNIMGELTSAERKAATVLTTDYPFAGLLTVAELGKRANVSGQTILRFIAKLGFDGYSAFQAALIGEIKESYQSPVVLREVRGVGKPDGSFLGNLAESAAAAMRETALLISEEQFDEISRLLSDQRRQIFLLGGRITGSLADYLFHHLRQIRSKIYTIPVDHEEWPEYLLRMGKKDIVIMFDYRRYQPDLLLFAERAMRERSAQIILITDKWLSPISKYSTHILPCAIDVGTPWDTGVSGQLLIEGIINKISEADWPKTKRRIKAWDSLRIRHSKSPLDDEQQN